LTFKSFGFFAQVAQERRRRYQDQTVEPLGQHRLPQIRR